MQFLSGKKTYIVAGLAILAAVLGYFDGDLDIKGAVEAVFAALGTMGLRSAITAETSK